MIVEGKFRRGAGKAHLHSHAHEPYFGMPMIGTFNLYTQTSIEKFPPTISGNGKRYWRVIINNQWEAWAFRWDGSRQPLTTWELVSRERLPNELRKEKLNIEIKEA